MNKYLARQMLRRLLKNSTFTDEQAKAFTEYLERFLNTNKGAFALEQYSNKDFMDELTDWIEDEPDYDDKFWQDSKPKPPRSNKMIHRLAARAVNKRPFTRRQKKKFKEYLTRWLDTPEGSKAALTLDAEKMINVVTDWIKDEPDYDADFWKPSERAGWF